MARTKGKARKGAKAQLSTTLGLSQSIHNIDIEDLDCNKQIKELIRRLDKTCQAQAIFIQTLAADKRDLLADSDKASQDLTTLKMLLTRTVPKDEDGEHTVATMPTKDALHLFRMLSEDDEEESENDTKSDDGHDTEKMIIQFDDVELDGSASKVARWKAMSSRRCHKLERRKETEADLQLQKELTKIANEAAEDSTGLEQVPICMQGESEVMTFDITDPFWQGM